MKVRSTPLANSRWTAKKMVEDKLMICQCSHSKQGTQLQEGIREGERETERDGERERERESDCVYIHVRVFMLHMKN